MYYIIRVTKCSTFLRTEGVTETAINPGWSDNAAFAYMFM